ncbi:MAG: VPS10 domain-containing protein [Chloroflexota bacterium]
MKPYLSFLFLLLLLLSACAPASPNVEASKVPEATQTMEESQVAPLTVVETPLPAVVEAPIIEAPSIVNIEMLDEVYGWAITEERIIRTNDGGVTWYNVTPGNLADAGYLVYTSFLDADTAWVQFPDMNKYPNGGKLYRTIDGGLTWETFTTPFSGGSLHFVDANNGWMMADLGVGAGSMAVSIFQTSDGGKTWNRTYTNDPNLAEASDTLPLGGIKNLILPLDAETAWVGGVVYAPGQTYLFRSDDGGKTWFNINLVLPENTAESELSLQDMVFISPTNGLLALRITSETPQTIVYITEDGGNTWVQSPAAFEGYGILETPSASEMIFYTADQFYVTKDAGVNIQQISPEIKFGDSIIDMSFANSQTGWVITASPSNERTLYKTTDGGTTWTPLIP